MAQPVPDAPVGSGVAQDERIRSPLLRQVDRLLGRRAAPVASARSGEASTAAFASAPAVARPAAADQPAAVLPSAAVDLTAEDELIAWVRERVLEGDAEFQAFGLKDLADAALARERNIEPPPANFLFAAESDPHDPDLIFPRLRWGGQFVYVSRSRKRVAALPERFVQRGFEISRAPASFRRSRFGFNLPFLTRRIHYVAMRKTRLTLPKEISERFTYHVHLSRAASVADRPAGEGHVVLKEVPSFERVCARLRHKFPEAAQELVEKRARKFTEKIFPLFLTREAAMLKLLERDLPSKYVNRVPRVVEVEQDARGYVRKLWMQWLRAGAPSGRPLTQLEFARQAADMLRLMHDDVGVIHLDLRLDNVVITEHGVGFVDFGSAVRVGEDISGNPLLSTIFDELMRTSQIQRMLDTMTRKGMVTSPILHGAYGKVDPAVDLFYLAVQINHPLSNPDFRGLVHFDPASPECLGLDTLTQDVLKPRDPTNPPIKTARDFLRAIERLGFALRGSGLRR